jgi:peptidoglycan-N-acetylglucosamine deacetylase
LASDDGGVFAFASAQFFGSAGGTAFAAPITGFAPTPDGGGYWMLPSTPPPRLPFGIVSNRIPTSARVVALTFDAGSNADGLPSILSTLHAIGVPASFFLTGNFAGAFSSLSVQVAQAGYRIGDHSVDHPHFPLLSNAQIDAEVLGAAQTIRQVTGKDPSPLFRFPYGESDARTLAEVNRLGFVAVGWTVDTLGWEGTSAGISADVVVNRVMAALQPGEIVLMHVGSNPTDHSTLDADALPRVIAAIAGAGYSFVTLDRLLQPT